METPVTETEKRRPDTVVTSETLAEFQKHKLDIAESIKPDPVKEETQEEPIEAPVIEASEEVEEEVDADSKKVLKKTNSKIEQRFSELTKQRKEAQARADIAEKRAAELEAKLKPVPINNEESPKPNKDTYTDAFQYAEDLAKWSANNALKERDESDRKSRAENERKKIVDTWLNKVEQTKKENPDFEEKIKTSNVQVSDIIRDAIIESDVGPKILLHLAENPEETAKIGEMTIGRALVAIGKLEAKLAVVKETKTEPKEKEVEVSKAPPPISPLKGASSPVGLPINGKGEWTGTLDEYKEARRAGKIK